MEIERKFLINELPKELFPMEDYIILQGYLSVNPEVRIRSVVNITPDIKINHPFVLCIKGDGYLIREELEWDISENQFKTLANMIGLPMIVKYFRKCFVADDLIVECTIVDPNTKNEFIYCEVEFETVEEASKFVPPEWFGEEVTYHPDYKMKNYWKRTRMDE